MAPEQLAEQVARGYAQPAAAFNRALVLRAGDLDLSDHYAVWGRIALRSIRRAFTAEELRGLVPDDWEVQTLVPFRNLVVLEK
ncbi:MAG TPA: hypothetical protein VFF10_04440 [Trueperaceae bacterium]|nr:hypothetical protein [Trueperaceae bacterium]